MLPWYHGKKLNPTPSHPQAFGFATTLLAYTWQLQHRLETFGNSQKKNTFFFPKEQDFVKENRKSFGILQNIYIYTCIILFYFYFIFKKNPNIKIFKIKLNIQQPCFEAFTCTSLVYTFFKLAKWGIREAFMPMSLLCSHIILMIF